jgi:hypothetical protein
LFVDRVPTSETSPIDALVYLIPDGFEFVEQFIGVRFASQSRIGVVGWRISGQRCRPRDAFVGDGTSARDGMRNAENGIARLT